MHIVILVMAKNKDEADKIARHLISGKLAACVNIIPQVQSIFTWQEKIETEDEVLLIIKSRQSLFEKIEVAVKEVHSYSVPEIIALPIAAGSQEYLNWINESTEGK